MTTVGSMAGSVTTGFDLPPELGASSPAEVRGRSRDDVRLMVAGPSGITHHQFTKAAEILSPGDLLVVNNSATLPASVVVSDRLAIHFSTQLPGGLVVVEPRVPEGASSNQFRGEPPRQVEMPGGFLMELLAPFPVGRPSRLWAAPFDGPDLLDYLARHGRPIRYSHVDGHYPLRTYQTIFAQEPGSAEMPSAGRPFSGAVLARLAACGVGVAPLTLHTGVSSIESGEPPYPEWYSVPAETARAINRTREDGGRVVSVGTTVVRALQSVTDRHGVVHAGSSWTDLVIEEADSLLSIDGLLTGWHEPRSTHLDLLAAVAGRGLLDEAYRSALDERYLWHEFGDSLLILRSTHAAR